MIGSYHAQRISLLLTFNTKWVNSLADVDMFELNIGVSRVVKGF